MPLKLASQLVSSGHLAQAAADDALQRQAASGGALDTLLLESRTLDENLLMAALALASGLSPATRAQLAAADPAVAKCLAVKLAERHGIVPLSNDGRVVEVASVYPVNEDMLEEIGFMIGRVLAPRVAVELRVREAIARVYGRPLAPRFAALAAALDAAPPPQPALLVPASPPRAPAPLPLVGVVGPLAPRPTRPPPGVQAKAPAPAPPPPAAAPPPKPSAPPPEPRKAEPKRPEAKKAEPKRARTQEVDGLNDAIARVLEEAEPEPWIAAAGGTTGKPRRSETIPAPGNWTLGQAKSALERAEDRDAVVDVTLRFARKTFEFAAAYAIVGGHAVGWIAHGPDAAACAHIEDISVPLDAPSVLRTVVMARGRYLGPMPSDPTSQSLLAEMGRGTPRACFLFPIELAERVVAIVYADHGPKSPSDKRIGEFALFAQQVGRKLGRIILDRKVRLATTKRANAEAKAAAAPEPRPWSRDDAVTLPPYLNVPPPKAARPAPEARRPEPKRAEPAARVPMQEPSGSAAEGLGGLAGLDASSAFPLSRFDDGTPALVLQSRGASRRPLSMETAAEAASFSASVRMPSMAELFSAVDRLLGSDVAERARALHDLERYPEVAAAALIARFPGPLLRARLPVRELPEAVELGPIPTALARLGAPAAQGLRPLLDHPDLDIRYFAVLTAGRLPFPPLVPPISQRVFDKQPTVSSAARAALGAMRGVDGFDDAVMRLRRQLGAPHADAVAAAARALGELHDLPAIDDLIPLTGHPDRTASQAAADALREMTKQSLGPAPRKWASWWGENRDRPRAEWLIAALKHKDLDLRVSAIDELVRLVNENFGFYADGPKRERDEAVARWESWWEREGKARGLVA